MAAFSAGFILPYNLLIINGPNLGRLGEREPQIYGSAGLDELPGLLMECLGDAFNRVEFSYYQSNHEGLLIDRLEEAHDAGVDGIIINAGALTHTSLALADCLAWLGAPYVEVHISNVFARKEEIRHKSFIAARALGVISGFGLEGYALAAAALMRHLDGRG